MPATDGVTPLNAANVQWKAGVDSRTGNLVFDNCAIVLANTTYKLPFYYEVLTGGRSINADLLSVSVQYAYVLQDPTPFATLHIDSSNGVNTSSSGITAFATTFKAQRGCIVDILPLTASGDWRLDATIIIPVNAT